MQILQLDDSKVLGGAGPQADRVRFLEYIEKNVKLNALRTGLTASCHGTAHYVRREVSVAGLPHGPAMPDMQHDTWHHLLCCSSRTPCARRHTR